MRLISLELKNFCQHQLLKVDFSSGLTGIVGPIGSGKSNILLAIESIFSGSFSGWPGVRSDCVRASAGPGEASWVRLLFAPSPSSQASILRSLRPIKQRLIVGDETLTKESDISDRLDSWLTMPAKVFCSFAFARQWQIFDLLETSPSIRAKSMNRLFRLDHAEYCRDAISYRLRTIDVPVPPYEEANVRKHLDETKLQLGKCKDELSKLHPLSNQDSLELKKWIGDYEIGQKLITELCHVNKRLAAVEPEYEVLLKTDSDIKQELSTLESEYSDEKLFKANKDLNTWTQFNSMSVKAISLEQELEKLKKLDPIIPDPLPEKYPPYSMEDCSSDLLRLNTAREKLEDFIRTFDPDTGLSECPKCGTSTKNLADLFEEYKAELPAVKHKIDIVQADLKEYQEYRRRLSNYELEHFEWKNQVTALEKQIKYINSCLPALPDKSLDETESTIKALYIASRRIKELRAKQDVEQQKLNSTLVTKEKYSDQVQKLELELADLPISDADIARYPSSLKQLSDNTAVITRVTELQVEISILRARVKEEEDKLVEIDTFRTQSSKVIDWKKTLENIHHDILHPNALPRLVAQSYLEQLEHLVNDNLEILGVDFRIQVADELSFMVHFPDTRGKQPSGRLSGGEKVIFALAWRLAVHEAFASNVGVFCLDEPTAGLDGDRLGSVRRGLERMKDLSGQRGLQCVIVTHEKSLMPLFDKVIELRAS